MHTLFIMIITIFNEGIFWIYSNFFSESIQFQNFNEIAFMLIMKKKNSMKFVLHIKINTQVVYYMYNIISNIKKIFKNKTICRILKHVKYVYICIIILTKNILTWSPSILSCFISYITKRFVLYQYLAMHAIQPNKTFLLQNFLYFP